MTKGAASLPSFASTLPALFIVSLLALWGCFALWFQVPGGRTLKYLSVAAWLALSVAMLFALWQGRAALGILGFAFMFGGLLLWWHSLLPSNDRVWADDVAKMTTGVVDGNQVTLHDVRNFDWRSDTEYTQRWETRTYYLDHLDSVDMILSYWSGQTIAHVLISFGFNDGDHVVFSVEIRPEKSEGFSEIGGFFKQFELSIIAADERDVIRVRTNVRGEDDYLYRIQISESTMRSLFLAYIEQANSLVRTPRFYNTVTVNCTTLVYHMVKHIIGYLPMDYRLLLSGYLPGYVYGVGGLDMRYSLKELRAFGRITERAKRSDRSATFSADIRRGVPRIEPSQLPASAEQQHTF
jgi:Domain of unknown function (DUF4105)